MKAHAKISASKLSRIALCPASMKLEDQFPDTKNEASIRGDRIHFLGEKFIFPSFSVNNDLMSFILLSFSKDIVICNSSYSWWAAWLNTNKNKKVFAPKNWFGYANKNLDTKDLFPEDWNIL